MQEFLEINVEGTKLWNETTEEFIDVPGAKLKLSHSLISISKWESRHKKAFMKEGEKTFEETLDYIRCMTINGPFPDTVYMGLTDSDILRIKEYIDDPMTATWFSDIQAGTQIKKIGHETVTSELVYYWMLSFNIPVEFEKWHFNRLMTLIKICSIKNQPEKKMSRQEILARNRALNAERRARLHSRG